MRSTRRERAAPRNVSIWHRSYGSWRSPESGRSFARVYACLGSDGAVDVRACASRAKCLFLVLVSFMVSLHRRRHRIPPPPILCYRKFAVLQYHYPNLRLLYIIHLLPPSSMCACDGIHTLTSSLVVLCGSFLVSGHGRSPQSQAWTVAVVLALILLELEALSPRRASRISPDSDEAYGVLTV